MAFNPFHGFRKHSKVIFAILTIICMLTFVLAGNFRGGDALDWIVSLFGGGRKGDYVATLYGSKVYDAELSRQGYDRNLANFFMAAAAEAGSRETQAELRREVRGSPRTDASLLDIQYHNAVKAAYLLPLLSGRTLSSDDNAVLKRLYPNDHNPRASAQREAFQLFASSRDLEGLRERLLKKDMEREAQLIGAIQLRELLMRSPQAFFASSTRRQDLLDERVFWHDADKLGIKFTEAAIQAEVNRLSPVKDLITNKGIQSPLLREALSQRYKGGVDMALVYKALGNELRASLAQSIVLGYAPGFHGVLRETFRRPAGITPAEYVNFYDKQRTTLSVDLIAVPAEAFLPEVDRRLKEGKLSPPKESQLQAIFDAAKTREPDPGSSTPGFKEPQRIGLQWIALRGPTEATFRRVARTFPGTGYLTSLTDPRDQHYRKLTRTVLELAGSVPPGPLHPLSVAAWAFRGREALLDRAYEGLMTQFEVPSLLQADPALAYYTALNLPGVVASTLGMTAPAGSLLAPLNTVVTSQQAATLWGKSQQADALKEDVRKRAQLVAGMTLASIAPPLTRATTWAAVTEVSDSIGPLGPALQPRLLPQYVNREAIRTQVFNVATAKLARFLQQKDLDDLTKAIEEAGKDPETARAKVEAALKRHPWLVSYKGHTAKPVDRPTLATSPEYRFLLKGEDTRPQTLQQRLKEARWYFGGDKDPEQMFAPRDFLPDKLFSPVQRRGMFGGGDPWVLVWKTEDVPARTPGSLTEVRDKVLTAWKLQEARKLARAKANEIRDKLAGKKPDEALKVMRGLLAENPSWGYLIHLDKVARQVPIDVEDAATPLPQAHAQGTKPPTRYEGYQVPEEDIAYPPANFVNQLVELPAHKAIVIADRPQDRFYVAYAEKRSAPPSVDDVLAKTFPKDVARDIRQNRLWQLMEGEKQQDFREELMKELRRQAGTLNAQGRFALNPNLKAEGNRGSAEE
jgi:hypothetical protein